jgi:ATP-dependent Clp protease, protease subunit
MNFNIKNSKEEIATIDLFGGVGESWFDDSISMQLVNDRLNEITASEIVVNVSSLGGDVNHAFAIYDLLKFKKAKITTRVIGMTASAGTIIAVGGDVVEMSRNALFLVHNAWTVTGGNAEEHEKAIETLKAVDDRLVEIYKKKLKGKKRSQIETLMSEERWITADEALEWGFIDKIIEPSKIENSVYNAINESNLPKINNKMENEKSFLQEIKDIISNIGKPDDKIVALKSENETLQAKVTEFETLANTKEVEKAEALATIETINAELANVRAKNETLATELETIKASKTSIDKNDPVIDGAKKSKEDIENEKILDSMLKKAGKL